MLGEMSPGQFEEWLAYADVDPFDQGREDSRAGSIVQEIRNHKRTRGQPYAKLADCVLQIQPREAEPPEAVQAITMSSLHGLVALAREMKAKRKKAETVRKRHTRLAARLAPAPPQQQRTRKG